MGHSRRHLDRKAGLTEGPRLRSVGLPTLASVNHPFDRQTPGGPNNEAANGADYGPPAPPRDGRHDIGDLMECFDFSRRSQMRRRHGHGPRHPDPAHR